MTGKDRPHLSLADVFGEKAERMHHLLGEYFLEVERSVRQGRFKDGAFLLGEMIRLVKNHFEHEDDMLQDAGINDGLLGNLIHNAFVERAREIQSRCLKQIDGADDETIHEDLVFLLSDIVEEDFRMGSEGTGERH